MPDHDLTLFDDWLHETYYAPYERLGEILAVRTDDDWRRFREWAYASDSYVAYDVETKGLNIYQSGWDMHTVQWGDKDTAFVFVTGDPRLKTSIEVMLDTGRILVAHNAVYDAMALDRCGYADSDAILGRTRDTFILSHLINPVEAGKYSSQHGLKDLAAKYVHESAKETGAALARFFKSSGWKTDDKGYWNVPSGHPTLVEYGGTDVLLTARLYDILMLEVQRRQVEHLVDYEHDLQRSLAQLQRKGLLVDVDYAARLDVEMGAKVAEHARALDAKWGVSNMNSNAQKANALIAHGARLTKITPSGGFVTDKDVMAEVAADSSRPEAAELAALFTEASRMSDFRTRYVLSALNYRDADNRVHPTIKSLGARTGRMAVSGPPLQQLPSDDDLIRRIFLAETGHVVCAVDFAGVELRVLAALSGDQLMTKAFRANEDLHQITGDSLGVPRSIGKIINFAKVYGSGVLELMRQSGRSEAEVLQMIRKFDETYPGVKEYDKELALPIKRGQTDHIRTVTGRYLPVDDARPYAAVNYAAQSAARDVLCKAITNLSKTDLWEFAMLPIHDEILFSFPEGHAEELAVRAAASMECVMKGIHMKSEVKIGQRSWGSLYADGEYVEMEATPEARRKYGTDSVAAMFS